MWRARFGIKMAARRTWRSVGRDLQYNRSSHEIKLDFSSVQIFKDQILGMGSYGAVYKAKCDDLVESMNSVEWSGLEWITGLEWSTGLKLLS